MGKAQTLRLRILMDPNGVVLPIMVVENARELLEDRDEDLALDSVPMREFIPRALPLGQKTLRTSKEVVGIYLM